MMVFSGETVLALGYSGFLVAISGIFELLARHIHQRSERSTTAGFTYRRELDAWECPDGKTLQREFTDPQFKIIRYRAPAHHCNSCVFKFRCTDSTSGRVIEHRLESWMESGLYRFHRVLSVALLLLAGLILGIELLRAQELRSGAVIFTALIFVAIVILRITSGLRRPADRNSSETGNTPNIAA